MSEITLQTINDQVNAVASLELKKTEEISKIRTELEEKMTTQQKSFEEKQALLEKEIVELKRLPTTSASAEINPEAKFLEMLGSAIKSSSKARSIDSYSAIDNTNENFEIKSIRSDIASSGGITLPKGFVNNIIYDLKVSASLRNLVTTEIMPTLTLYQPIAVPMTIEITAENGVVFKEKEISYKEKKFEAVTTPVKITLNNHMLSAKNGFDIMSSVRQQVVEFYKNLENAYILYGKGDSAGQYEGLLTSSLVNQVVLTGSNDPVISYKNLTALKNYATDINPNNGVFIFNQSTLSQIENLKDEAGRLIFGSYYGLATPNVNSSIDLAQGTLLGKRYYIVNEMPDAVAGNVPIIYGDFSNYILGDYEEFNIKIDPTPQNSQGQHLNSQVLLFSKSTAGGIVRENRFVKLKIGQN